MGVVDSSSVFVVKGSGWGFWVPADWGVRWKASGHRVDERVGSNYPEYIFALYEFY